MLLSAYCFSKVHAAAAYQLPIDKSCSKRCARL